MSMLGDQFTIIATPWLVLKLTADPFSVGTTVALSAGQRLLFLLVGGTLVDQYSPKTVLLIARYVNTIVLGTFACLVLSGNVNLWEVYVFALATGTTSAFSYPASRSIVPQIVAVDQIQVANSIMDALRQIAMIAAPVVAGLLIATLGDGRIEGTQLNARGLGVAYLFDAFTFVVSSLTLLQVSIRSRDTAADKGVRPSLLKLLSEGIRYCWSNLALRALLLYAVMINLCVNGPVTVAIPVLALEKGRSVASLGVLTSAYAAGMLIGIVSAGFFPKMVERRLGTFILSIDFIVGLMLIPMGYIVSVWQGGILLFIIGTLAGFMQVAVPSWLQKIAIGSMIGRVLSLFMLVPSGIGPLSGLLSGWFMRSVTVAQLFVGAGILLSGIALLFWVASPFRRILDAAGSPNFAR